MPDGSHVGRRYGPVRHRIEAERVRRYRAAAGMEPGEEVPPTYAAVHCVGPVLGELFGDEGLGLRLDGLIHSEQSFEWSSSVAVGEEVEASGVIASVEERRGLVLVSVEVQARAAAGRAVCSGRSVLMMRGGG